jgi:hypothetical protein
VVFTSVQAIASSLQLRPFVLNFISSIPVVLNKSIIRIFIRNQYNSSQFEWTIHQASVCNHKQRSEFLLCLLDPLQPGLPA